jgi:hypothetical protein
MIFIFFVEGGGGGGGGVIGDLISGSEPEWEMRRTGWARLTGALCTGFTLVMYKPSKTYVVVNALLRLLDITEPIGLFD